MAVEALDSLGEEGRVVLREMVDSGAIATRGRAF